MFFKHPFKYVLILLILSSVLSFPFMQIQKIRYGDKFRLHIITNDYEHIYAYAKMIDYKNYTLNGDDLILLDRKIKRDDIYTVTVTRNPYGNKKVNSFKYFE